jgi:hypothetical protein
MQFKGNMQKNMQIVNLLLKVSAVNCKAAKAHNDRWVCRPV